MKEYILLMHEDALELQAAADPRRWEDDLVQLRRTGQFDGGSEIGAGVRFRKGQAGRPATTELGGFLRVRASSLANAPDAVPCQTSPVSAWTHRIGRSGPGRFCAAIHNRLKY